MRESQFKAEAMVNEAKSKAKNLIEESDQRAKEILFDMEERLKLLVDNYKKLEATRDDLISEIKRLASDTLDRVERARHNALEFDADQHLNQIRRETKKAIFPNLDYKLHVLPAAEEEQAQPVILAQPDNQPASHPVIEVEKEIVMEQHTTTIIETQTRKVQRSFFDEIV
jgi:cell division initiation protein